MGNDIDVSQHFLKMIRTGQFKVEKDGRIISQGVQMIMIPALTFSKIHKDVPPKLLYKFGEYQAKKGIELHSKFFGLSLVKVAIKFSEKLLEKTLDFIGKSWMADGYGIFKVEKFDWEKRVIIISNYVNPIARCYLRDFGKSKRPIDYYISGLFGGGLSILLKRKVKCVEEKCIACGDPACVFVIRW
ncbi:MAG: 4-vinyl reductase [Candidatus Aenigmatarchaeota archaeon]